MNDETMPAPDIFALREQWPLVQKVCRQKKRTVAAVLHSARPIMLAEGDPYDVVIEADFQFHLDILRKPENRAVVEWALEQVLEHPCHVRLILAGVVKSTAAVETPTPVPDVFYRDAKRQTCITNRLRASFRALRLLDHADSEIVLAVGEVMLKRYASEPFIVDLWRSAQCWSEEWQA